MGGVYERLVGIVKRALRKALGKKLLLMDQISTVVKEIEAVVNRRPLVYVGEDIKSSITLTPGHFLCLNPKTGIPNLDYDYSDPEFKPYESSAERLLQLWKKGERLLNKFVILWRDEYLLSLRERSQNKIKSVKVQSSESPNLGDIVIIKDDLPRGQWKLAKIINLRTSRDGQVRSAELETSIEQILRRPLNLLYPIEMSESKIRDPDIKRNSHQQETEAKNCQLKTLRPMRKAAEKARQMFQNM
ncbi:uncharacterized protein LOC132753738 [Ruditapes philippinarum]|uniref:uncharacterized protein LOC132753738 n=1 Tax=Ruditapes philippinarum TaxID=129788 RepID=UPI00295BE313|nr:uncharacterized protein LOC132753738 [Ruditapes philippinarum]